MSQNVRKRNVVISSSKSHDANAGVAVSLVRDTRCRSPPSEAVKLTRSQLKEKSKTLPEPKSLVDGLGQEQTMKEETVRDIPSIPVISTSESAPVNGMSQTALDAPASPLPNAVPNVISNLRVEMPAKRSTSNKENVEPSEMESPQPVTYDVLEDAAVSAATPPRSGRDSSVMPEDHILALDELDEAVETVSKDIPEVQTSPEKPKGKRDVSKKPAPVVRTTKAAAARISMAHNKDPASKPPAMGRPSPSKALGRSNSVRQPSSGSNRVISTSSTKDDTNGEKKEVVIPHSKPRPISLSFPTPPPPPKSRKAPTQSTFKLPGEAVAEKLKAAREARTQKEAGEQKKQPFKARPVPAGMSKAPSVRQTSASKARESLMTGKDVKPVPSTSTSGPAHKRANSVATTRPTAQKPRVTSTDTLTAAMNSSVARLSAPRKRPSTAMADISKPRASLATSTGPSGLGRIPSGQTTGTAKGKEVFNRAAAAKAAANKEKSDKEEATKKARVEAAERSKQAAREWAEKQKRKQLAAKQAAQKNEEPACVAASTPVEA